MSSAIESHRHHHRPDNGARLELAEVDEAITNELFSPSPTASPEPDDTTRSEAELGANPGATGAASPEAEPSRAS